MFGAVVGDGKTDKVGTKVLRSATGVRERRERRFEICRSGGSGTVAGREEREGGCRGTGLSVCVQPVNQACQLTWHHSTKVASSAAVGGGRGAIV